MSTTGADVQIENGKYTKIHNTLLEKIACADLNASEFKCLLYLLRKTYGWNKKEDTLSYGQIAEGTGLSRRGVIASMQSLTDQKVIHSTDPKIGRKGCRTYSFNKYFEQWTCIRNGEESFTISDDENSEESCTIDAGNSEETFTIQPEMVNNPSLEMVNNPSPTKDNKDNNNKSEAAAVFACWKDNMPGTMSSILADDLGDLIDTYGADTVIRAITEAVRSNGRSIRYVAKILENWATGKTRPNEKPIVAPPPPTAGGIVAGFDVSTMIGG